MPQLDRVVKMPNPYGLDIPIGQMQDHLALRLAWLTHVFGQAQYLPNAREKRQGYYPAVPLENGEYIDALPDDTLGNTVFFATHDPIETTPLQAGAGRIMRAQCSIVFWADLRTIYGDLSHRSMERFAQECMNAVDSAHLLSGSFATYEARREAKHIYREYDIKEVSQQFLMHPFAGLRIDGTLTYKSTNCP